MPAELLARVDVEARRMGGSRAKVVRRLLAGRLVATWPAAARERRQ
jgi:Ribbon-helix-helix protein, copG family